MKFLPIKTRKFLPPKDDIYRLLDESVKNLRTGDILVITSKILGIHEGRCVKIKTNTHKEKIALAFKEADKYVPEKDIPRQNYFLTIKNNTLVGAAGIDRSNGNGYYILWPKNPQKLLKEIWQYLKKKHKVTKLGVISVDSHFLPLRAGAVGTAIGFYGFHPVIDYRGKPDIFGRKLRVTRTNLVDSIAAATNLLMGEGSERTPLLIVRNLKMVKFTGRDTYKDWVIRQDSDIFRPLLKLFKKPKNR
jgi:F420-0:gamma-glutamyl ligase